MSNIDVVYNAETGLFNGSITVETTTSFNADMKAEAIAARKNGTDRPVGGEVPHSVRVNIVDATLEDILEQAVKPVVIRTQREIKTTFADNKAFENGVNNKTFDTELKAERRTVDPATRIKRDSQKLTPEERQALIEELMQMS